MQNQTRLPDGQVPKNWQEVKLGDISNIRSGDFVPKEERKGDGEMPMYGSGGIVGYTNRSNISGPTIVVGRVGAFGTVNLVEGGLATDNTLIVTNKPNTDINFLYYKMRAVPFGSFATGSSQQLITQTAVAAHEITVPPLDEQQKIASILSAFDDKIEVNNRIAKTLEEMAQAIFKEWFVKFRFPGHGKAEFVDSGLGKIPKEWEVARFDKYSRLEYGKALQENKRNDGMVLVYGSSGLVGTHNEKLCSGPGIVIGRKGNVGSIFWVNEDYFPIDTTFYVKSQISLYYIYYMLKNMRFYTGDSAVPGLNRESVHSQYVAISIKELIIQFENLIKPMFDKSHTLAYENQKLAALRDLLLPKLMRGEVRV